MDAEARRLKQEWLARQKATAREAFPLSNALLAELFAEVEVALANAGCDHTRKLTEKWLSDRSIPQEPVLDWLDENSGYCDCEVVANSGEHFESNRE